MTMGEDTMAELTTEQKHSIIVLLAHFRSPTEIAAHARQELGVELSVQQIVKYDPTRAGYEAGEKWRPIFEAARESFLGDVLKVPLAHAAYRLNLLQEGVEAARKARNWKLVAELLTHAAKEVGGAFTNERQLRVTDGLSARDMSPEERRELLTSRILDAFQRRPTGAEHISR
jgi:hypothetical protein